jgi:dihydrolipoamide dehydrogenase
MTEKYKAVVLGAGPGGYVAALRLGNEKQRVAVVESRDVGGTCLNRGCIPTKALLHSSEIASQIRGAEKHGLTVGKLEVNLAAMMKRKDEVVRRLKGGVQMLLKSRKADVYAGRGKLTSANTVEVQLNQGGSEVLEAENIIIATGSEPLVPGVFPQERSKVMTSDEILELQELPESLLIFGGGYI